VLTGGGRWRLVLHGADDKLVLRGWGDGRAEEAQVAALLGDRLATAWLHSPRELVAVRNAVGRAGMVIGGLALAAALALAVAGPASWPRSSAPLLAIGGVLALVVAVLPDLVMEVVWRVRGPAARPEPLVVRHPARPALRVPTTDAARPLDPELPEPPGPAEALRPGAATGSAMAAMTLDLGDLPGVPDWPEEVIDLDDLPDLPDWPPELAEHQDTGRP
jgi:hypothetical protein